MKIYRGVIICTLQIMQCLLKVVTKNGRGALESQWRIYRGISQRSALVGKRVSICVAGHQEQRRRQRQTHKGTPPERNVFFRSFPLCGIQNSCQKGLGHNLIDEPARTKGNLLFTENG